ncbi:hypothetical protein VB780_01015 [Leptolyngbya sp. CCNP1308]|uniref:hypothetical protein n=1 Tax=Leptolyngbya sp. CCNP1308 TaxID=3110255 RepID=UPI002B21FD30|nr:hypothetical protein [Leptolyngbya sp. CCNP1308]MEA5447130.1 hypothetical protein [Leptolyngbya sp. CCNP1308]
MSPYIELRAVGPEYLWIGTPGSDAVIFQRRYSLVEHPNRDLLNPIWCDGISALLVRA